MRSEKNEGAGDGQAALNMTVDKKEQLEKQSCVQLKKKGRPKGRVELVPWPTDKFKRSAISMVLKPDTVALGCQCK